MQISMGAVVSLAESVAGLLQDGLGRLSMREPTAFAGIPRGGIPAAMMVAKAWADLGDRHEIPVFSSDDVPESFRARIVLVDDIRVTGNTMARAKALFASNVMSQVVLVHKGLASDVLSGMEVPANEWVTFPWETRENDGKPEDAVSRLIEYLGDDPTRDELLETPARVLRFYDELRTASEQEITATTFDSTTKDLVVISGIPFASLCEHHMLPFFGEAAIGYIPNGYILGLSKPARAVQQAAAALTVQEHLTAQVAEQISEWAKSPNVGVVTTAVHSCMVIRGVKAVGSRTSSSAMLGSFRTAPELRAEFFSVVEGASRL